MQGENKRPSIREHQTYRDVTSNSYQPTDSKPKESKRFLQRIPRWLIIVVVTVIALGSASLYYYIKSNSNTLPYPINKQTAQTLGFNIYYPNQKLLPAGYTLNKNSFSYTNQTIIYTVSSGTSSLVFSVQAKPSTAQIKDFYSKNMPLNTTQSTKIGAATIGAVNGQTLVSLPTNTNAWLLITAPSDVDQQTLNQVIQSIELAK